MTTGRNILWATDSYKEQYSIQGCEQVLPELVKKYSIIVPRVAKRIESQKDRTKKRAEVFTPSWICNKMNSDVDEEWFGYKDAFNTPHDKTWTVNMRKVKIPKDKNWKEYVSQTKLEITCGEAPFITTRYDAMTGDLMPVNERIGFLDRKLRIVRENAYDEEEYFEQAFAALKSCYGYEYQGDNLLIARINVFLSFAEAVKDINGEDLTNEQAKEAANIIAWNIWQMDGLKGTVPDVKQVYEVDNGAAECLIKDWMATTKAGKLLKNGRTITYNSMKEA